MKFLTFLGEKSKAVHFANKSSVVKDLLIKLYIKPIPYIEEIEFLGIIFYQKLIFKS